MFAFMKREWVAGVLRGEVWRVVLTKRRGAEQKVEARLVESGSQSVGWSVSKLGSQSIGQLVIQLVGQLINQSVG